MTRRADAVRLLQMAITLLQDEQADSGESPPSVAPEREETWRTRLWTAPDEIDSGSVRLPKR